MVLCVLSSYLICRDNIFIFGVFWVFPSSGPFLYEEHFVTLIVGCWVIDVLLFWKCFWKWVCWFISFNILMIRPVYYPDVLQFRTSCIWGSLEMLLQWNYDKFSLFWEIMARTVDWLKENLWRLSNESERLSLPYSVAIFVTSNYFFTARPDAFHCLCYFYWSTILTLFLFLEELARDLVCEISQSLLEFPLGLLLDWHYIFLSVIKIARFVW